MTATTTTKKEHSMDLLKRSQMLAETKGGEAAEAVRLILGTLARDGDKDQKAIAIYNRLLKLEPSKREEVLTLVSAVVEDSAPKT